MRRIILIIIVLLAPLIAMTATAEKNLLNAKAPEFALQDQYDKTVVLRELEGRIVALIASDREGRVQNPPWKEAITAKYGESIAVLGVADVQNVPFFLRGKTRNDLKKDEGSILLDWKGDVFTQYGLAKGVSNIVVIDKRGYIRFMCAGAAAPETVQRLFQELDKLER